MARYDHLTELLNGKHGEPNISIDVTMDEIADAVSGGLPPSANKFEAWWSNDDAGYAGNPDLYARKVRFSHRRGERRRQ